MGRLFEELKRRNVFRVAVAYLVGAWLVLQVAEFFLEIIVSPEWVMQVFTLVFALGFPFVLMFSWAYEITPEGIKREKDVNRERSITDQTGRKLDIATIVMLIGVLVVFGIERTFFNGATTVDRPVSVSSAPENSIAVLAFDDLSPEGNNAYFAEGLSEELLNVLAQVADLQVAGRTSSFAFKDEDRDLREIGEILNVAHILEGSVRKAGNRIRVTAQLIQASTGYHLYSETYDRDLDDIFAVQDEIAGEISNALLSEIVGTETVGAATPTDPEAYELYLLARQRLHSRDLPAMREASAMLDRALEIDPDYAPALAQKALSLHLLSDAIGAYGDIPKDEAISLGHEFLDRAMVSDDSVPEIYAVRGLLLYTSNSFDEAMENLEKAVELNPTMSDAKNWLANTMNFQSRRSESIEIFKSIVERDPLYGPGFNNLILAYARTSRFDDGDNLISRMERISGENIDVVQSRQMLAIMRGDLAEAIRLSEILYEDNPTNSIATLFYGLALRNLGNWETMAARGIDEYAIYGEARLATDDELDVILSQMDFNRGFRPRKVRYATELYNLAGKHQEAIDFVDHKLGSLDALLEEYPASSGWYSEYLGELAFAHLQVGDEATFRRLHDEMRRVLDVQRGEGTDNQISSVGEAQYAALAGDYDETLNHMRRALGQGLIRADEFKSPIYDGLRDDPRFQQIEVDMLARLDEERAKLGLGPYRPFQEDSSSFVN